MSKKQFGIIFTLMALIAFVGVLAARLNSTGLNDPTDLTQFLLEEENKEENKDDKKDDKETIGTQDYFYAIRIEKEQLNAITLEQLNTVINNENTSQEEFDLANNEFIEKTMLIDKEGRVEVNIKNKGFEDALCSIEGEKVRIVIAAEEVSESDSASIQEIVENITGIGDVIIEPKK